MQTCFADIHEKTCEYCHHSTTEVQPALQDSCTDIAQTDVKKPQKYSLSINIWHGN